MLTGNSFAFIEDINIDKFIVFVSWQGNFTLFRAGVTGIGEQINEDLN